MKTMVSRDDEVGSEEAVTETTTAIRTTTAVENKEAFVRDSSGTTTTLTM
jgi:hypothetical protein